MEEEIERKPVTTVREYLQNATKSFTVFQWIERNLVDDYMRRHLKIMMGCLAITFVFVGLQPGAVSYIFTGLSTHDQTMVIKGLIGLSVCLALTKLFERNQERAREHVVGRILLNLNDRITELALGKSIGQHVSESSRLSSSSLDKGKWQTFDLASLVLFDAAMVVPQIIISIIFLTILDWRSGLIIGATMSTYFIWTLYINYQVSKECTPIDHDMRKIGRRRVERWEQIERVAITGKENREQREIRAIEAEIIDRDRTFWLWCINIANTRSLVNVAGLIAAMSWGVWLVWTGQIQIGMLYALYMWASRTVENLWRLGDIEHRINWNLPAVQSMIDALSIPPDVVDKPDAIEIDPHTPQRIEFVEVSHTYPKDAKVTAEAPPAIRNVSFTIEPGEKVALLGPSGAGKSTVMKKLLRFSDPTKGSIRVNGHDLRDIKLSSWRQGIGFVPQNASSQILDGTIIYNMCFGLSPEDMSRITEEDVWRTMQSLQIDFGPRLTEGLKTRVGKHGLKLSGGEGQRVMIGAAVIKNPQLLVIDEATSSLDSVTEKLVQDGIAQALQPQTSALIIAHRLTTVRDVCNKFVVLRPTSKVGEGEGQVEAIATSFEELYKISPTFRALADTQGVVIN